MRIIERKVRINRLSFVVVVVVVVLLGRSGLIAVVVVDDLLDVPCLLLLPKRTTTTTTGRRSIRTFHLIILVFHIVRIRICFPFLLVNLHILMGRTTDFGVTKCVVIYSLSIQAYGRL